MLQPIYLFILFASSLFSPIYRKTRPQTNSLNLGGTFYKNHRRVKRLFFSYACISHCYTSVLWVCILTFFTLPFLEKVGDDPENPGFWMPKPSLGLGFFKLDLSGDLVTEEPTVEPLEPTEEAEVMAVLIEAMLPLVT